MLHKISDTTLQKNKAIWSLDE